ncbi:signal peptidase I [Candidatus Gracilibacteria bacterium]|nr:MAG: signal peptidase I [Candidatus Gracilibacteria bacterium]
MSGQKPYQENREMEETNSAFMDFIKFLRDFVILLIIVILIRYFVVTPFRISGDSMETAYHDGEYILVNRLSYLNFDTHFDNFIGTGSSKNMLQKGAEMIKKIPLHIGDPVRGDVVVITPHIDTSKEYYIKRVIGMPGDTIRFENGNVSIKTTQSQSFIELREPYLSANSKGFTFLPTSVGTQKEFIIPDGHYWVMGDNRQNSADSRNCFQRCTPGNQMHLAPRKDIIGRVLLDFGNFDLFKDGEFPKLGTLKWVHHPRFFDTQRNAEYPELEK